MRGDSCTVAVRGRQSTFAHLVSIEVRKQGNGLDSFTQSHLICKDPIEPILIQRLKRGGCAAG